ncbi:hypothetical protein BCR37DRAFT_250240 [Protomyces lactucae-debilis]|uniref:Uncharacterized protein n=1 Tax=Protomyces lactucae-debilis TaxID=2754530 RepID=A0A1Y2FLE4_PROLT|nr:uncharacterized protein BCR37DRAFT_250240 [Protomyces lactucae-debilis]ORY84749.1 hypothetical protein BCR37DRAFT_250240 [Protomyces lactucae-debilis]
MDSDSASIRTQLPDYEAAAALTAPPYQSRHTRSRQLEPSRLRPPPRHLSERPAVLPAPSAQSPFEDAVRACTSRSHPENPIVQGSRRSFLMPSKPHSAMSYRPGVHQLHGVRDTRMHVPPALDEDGNPVRGLSKSHKAAMTGAAAAVVLAASCTIM